MEKAMEEAAIQIDDECLSLELKGGSTAVFAVLEERKIVSSAEVAGYDLKAFLSS